MEFVVVAAGCSLAWLPEFPRHALAIQRLSLSCEPEYTSSRIRGLGGAESVCTSPCRSVCWAAPGCVRIAATRILHHPVFLKTAVTLHRSSHTRRWLAPWSACNGKGQLSCQIAGLQDEKSLKNRNEADQPTCVSTHPALPTECTPARYVPCACHRGQSPPLPRQSAPPVLPRTQS